MDEDIMNTPCWGVLKSFMDALKNTSEDQMSNNINDDPYIIIRRQWNDWNTAQIRRSKLSGLCWDNISGGVFRKAPHYFIHGYAWCTEIEGDISHSCRHGPPPHSIKVCVVKKDNETEIYNQLLDVVGPKPPRETKENKRDKQTPPTTTKESIFKAAARAPDPLPRTYKYQKDNTMFILREYWIYKLPDGKDIVPIWASGTEEWILWPLGYDHRNELRVDTWSDVNYRITEFGKVLSGAEELCTLDELEDTGYYLDLDFHEILPRTSGENTNYPPGNLSDEKKK